MVVDKDCPPRALRISTIYSPFRLKRLMGACDASKVEELNQAIKAALDVR